jgi:hypothetical protein
MIEVETKVTAAGVETLRKNAESALETYSDSFVRHEESEATLRAAAGVRRGLIDALEAKRRLALDLRRAAVLAAISGSPGFATDAACVPAAESEAALLNLALRTFVIYGYRDAERAELVAKLAMSEAQSTSEKMRLQHHVVTIHLGLGQTASKNGGLQVEMGGVVKAMEHLCYRVDRDLDAVREELKAHDVETRGLRDAYEREQSK